MTRNLYVLAIILLAASAVMLLYAPGPSAQAQDEPGGIIAFVGAGTISAQVYLLDIGTGQIGLINTPVLPDADLAWQPGGDMLAFTTVDGNYAVLSDLNGCFTTPGGCENVTLFDPDDPVLGVEWSPDGAWLFLLHDDRIAAVSPLATAFSVTLTMDAACGNGLQVVGGDGYLLCATPNNDDNAVSVYQFGSVTGSEIELIPVQDLGSFATLTAIAIDETGNVALGTSEAGGESGWVSSADTAPKRIAPNQIHIYALAFTPDQLAVAGATADSTGDATLADGDLGELQFYDYETDTLTPIAGFTGASGLATSPESESVLIVIEQESFAFYTPSTETTTPLSVLMPQPGILINAVAWQHGEGALPPVPAATTAPPATIAPLPTTAPLPTLTPYPTFTPQSLPTLTPYPTFTPYPTLTPYIPPTVTPGSPAGVGCEYAYSGTGGLPVAIGDTAQVTGYGAGLRLRAAAGLYQTQLRELRSGAQFTVLNGPTCADGYRWWQVRLTDGTTGWVADSDGSGWWIEVAATVPTESINFWADKYSISSGECVWLYWELEGIREVYLTSSGGESPVTGSGSRNVCLTTTTTYSLRIIKIDGTITNPSVTITVGAAGQPDLVIYQIDHQPTTPNAGDIMQVRVRFRNVGTAPVTNDFTVVWYPGALFMAPACTWTVTADLAPGADDKVNCNYQYTSSHASIDMLAVVDFGDAVNESNNGNNSFTKTITVN